MENELKSISILELTQYSMPIPRILKTQTEGGGDMLEAMALDLDLRCIVA